MKPAVLLILMVLLSGTMAWRQSVSADAQGPVAYPAGYRSWSHVKSALVSPAHKHFAVLGGFQHIYANPAAMVG